MAITADDIEFDKLDTATLEELIRADEDQFIATDALHMLDIKDPEISFNVSKDIYKGNMGGKYLKGQALRILYLKNRQFILANLEECIFNYEHVVLEELVVLCWVDLSDYKADVSLRSYLAPLFNKLQETDIDSFENKEYVKELLTLYHR